MENHIYHLVNKLMEIFEVEEPALGQQWAQQFISGARQENSYVQPVNVSLDEIQSYRGDNNIRAIYNRIQREEGGLRNVDGVLHLAARIGGDDSNTGRKFIRLHKLIRQKKHEKLEQQRLQQQQQQLLLQQQQHQQQQQSHQQQQRQQLLQQVPPSRPLPQVPSTRITSVPINSTVPPTNPYETRQLSWAPPPPQTPTAAHHQLPPTPNQPVQQAPLQPNRTTLPPQRTPHHQNDLTTSMVAITPAAHRARRERNSSRKSSRGKNDVLYQKMRDLHTKNHFLSFDFKKIDWVSIGQPPPLLDMPPPEQESALILDLLYVLIGTEGKYIRMQPSRESPNKHTIGVDRGCDELVYIMATRIIKICPLYSTVVHYAEDVNFGLCNQALAAPIRDLVKEYINLISHLHVKTIGGGMTLQSMWYSLQDIFYRMEALKQILDQISRDACYGGQTLTVLSNRVANFSANPKTNEFCLTLLKAASEPYFDILQKWLYLGVIEDPHGEFFIEDTENKSETKNLFASHRSQNTVQLHQQVNTDVDTFWRKRFTRDDSKVPCFLKFKQEKIYDTGRYLSVVRHYGKKIFRPLQTEPLVYCLELREYDGKIDAAYKFASKELLDLLLVENKLIDRLYSLKRYFLFSSGDFFVQFMDMADEELSKTKEDINMAKLESLLELALRTSSCNSDPYKEDVHIRMSEGSLYYIMASINGNSNSDLDQASSDYCASSGNLLGWESLTLSYDVSWPLSMIICKDYCQVLYQMMFRHLFCCKYIERKLESTWRINRLLKFNNYEGAFALRHKMLHFVHNLLFYTIEIIEPSFQILISKFRDGGLENVGEVIELHRAFLSGLVHDSMLTDNELLGHVTKLLLLCMDFSVVIEARYATQELTQQEELQNTNYTRSRSINSLTCTKSSNRTGDETDAKSNPRPNIVVRPMTSDGSSSQGESYVASQVRKLSLSSQHSHQQNSKMQKSESIGNIKPKLSNPEEVFQARISEINEKFNKQLKTLLEALTVRSQDFTASTKLQNLFYRLDFNNFYTKRDLAA